VKFLPCINPATLTRLPRPFDHEEWIFEIKHDGFRALAYVEDGICRLVSRHDHVYKSFAPLCASIARLPVRSAILDGEIVCLDKFGRSVFDRLFYRQGTPYFYAFDLVWLNGRDLRAKPVTQRKALLQELICPGLQVLYLDYVSSCGVRFFDLVCQHDMEGIVAKWKDGRYDEPSWVKIRNPSYSQLINRREKFEKRSRRA